VSCPSCSTELPVESRFCNQCGAAASQDGAAPSSSERAPRDYTPKHLAEKILTQKAALEGERKQVTVLFADVKSSMDLQASIDPEEWHRIMDRFFQIMADGVHRFEGTVNQYTGDGIMALFGAPISHEDHGQRACYAALHLTDELREYARELRRERGLDFSTRMGINSGEVVVGKIGDDLRMDYTAQGHTVGLASRVEALAEPGTTYLTGLTAERVQGYFDLEDLGEFHVKGVSEPVSVFELKDAGELRTRFDVSRARGLSRFVGRDADMRVLESALESARAGKGRAVGIVADAGVGKSRLCFEFVERCRKLGMLVLEGHAVAHGKNIPLLPVLEVFRAYFAIEERDDPRRAREKIAGRLLLIDDQFREVLSLVFDFLGVPDPERPAPHMDPEARQRRLVAVVRRLIERANPDGFVILLEDLHWADAASDAFLAEWVDAINTGPGLLLMNFRPEYRADWMNKSWYQQLPLDPLGPEAIRELLGDLLGDDASVEGLADKIHERTRGNPYFTEEIVRALVDSRVLEGTKGSYRLTTRVESLDVPDSVHAVLSARIDRLAEREKQLLQTAAVIGKEFTEPILAAVAELPRHDLADALAALCNSEFIHQLSLYPIAEYAFAHPLTQEVALGSQLQAHRRQTHAAVARAMQEVESENLDEGAALVAHHFEEAGEELEAARWHARAANWAGTRNLEETLRHWQRVRDLLVALPESDETEETISLQLGACTQIVIGGWRMGLSERAVEALYEEGCALAERSGNQLLLVALRGIYGARLCSVGKIPEALAMNGETIELADRVGLPEMRTASRVIATYTSYLVGRLEETVSLAQEGEKLSGRDLTLGREIFGFSYLVWLVGYQAYPLAALGRCEEARRRTEYGLRLAHESEIRENLGWARSGLSVLTEYTGELAFEELGDARARALEAVQIAEEIGSTISRVTSYGSLGAAHLVAGEWQEAERALRTTIELSRQRGVGLEFEALRLTHLSRALLGGGDAMGARKIAEEAVAVSTARQLRHSGAQAYIALALALCASEGRKARSAVEGALSQAAELVEETGALGVAPWIPEARAELARVLGDSLARDHHLREAHRLYTEIGATGHARRLAGELGL
jgi:class 3 adenylate cyclase/tetratricopeptide (TPR) repeat protein